MAPTQEPSSSEAILAALTHHPGATAAELAEAAGIGRSTAAKALAALEGAGKARHTLGGRDGARRLPDRWTVTPPAKRVARARKATPNTLTDVAPTAPAPRSARQGSAARPRARLSERPAWRGSHPYRARQGHRPLPGRDRQRPAPSR